LAEAFYTNFRPLTSGWVKKNDGRLWIANGSNSVGVSPFAESSNHQISDRKAINFQ